MRLALVPILSLLLNAAGGCVYRCESILVFPVSVQVREADGTAIRDAKVQFSQDGGDFLDCANMENGYYGCGSSAGDIVVEVEWNGISDDQAFDIESGKCRPIGQSAMFTLEPPPV